jgi:hypothetical protein
MTKVRELDTQRAQTQARIKSNREVVKAGKKSLGEQLVDWVDHIMPDRI